MSDRRALLKRVVAASGSAYVLPIAWTQPLLSAVILPAHAQTSVDSAAANSVPDSDFSIAATGGSVVQGSMSVYAEQTLLDGLSASLSLAQFAEIDDKTLDSVEMVFEAAFTRRVELSNPTDSPISVRLKSSAEARFELNQQFVFTAEDSTSGSVVLCSGDQKELKVRTYVKVKEVFNSPHDFFLGLASFPVDFSAQVAYSLERLPNGGPAPEVLLKTITEENKVCVVARYRYSMIQPPPDGGAPNIGGSSNTVIDVGGDVCADNHNAVVDGG